MDMAWISGGYGSDIEGGGDSLLQFNKIYILIVLAITGDGPAI